MNSNIRRLFITLTLGMGLALALLTLGLTLIQARTQNSTGMTRITVASDSDRDSYSPCLNADGTLVAFPSDSDLLGQGILDNQVSEGVAWGAVITNTASLTSAEISTPTLGSVALHVLFHVTGTDPAPNSLDAALDTDLFFTANSAVSATTVTTETVVVHGGFQGHLDGDLHPGEVVQASVTDEVLSSDGVPIAPYVWEFRVATLGGSGVFITHPVTSSLPTYQISGVALGDLDKDGDLDVVLASSQSETVWLNDGAGGLSPHPTTPEFGAGSSRDVALGTWMGTGTWTSSSPTR
ncbi:MAG: hypothetical protein SXV54_24805 [Chloroflexota bacterium]|nr:hypothetical protein [Chloroflexota bacterium]